MFLFYYMQQCLLKFASIQIFWKMSSAWWFENYLRSQTVKNQQQSVYFGEEEAIVTYLGLK